MNRILFQILNEPDYIFLGIIIICIPILMLGISILFSFYHQSYSVKIAYESLNNNAVIDGIYCSDLFHKWHKEYKENEEEKEQKELKLNSVSMNSCISCGAYDYEKISDNEYNCKYCGRRICF